MPFGTITTDALALRLAQRLQARGVEIDDVEAFAAEFSPDLTAWMGGEGAVPADLSQKVTTAAAAWNTDAMQRLEWWTGTIDGGPNGDGEYPMTNAAGVTSLFPSLAKVLDSTSKGNAGWSAKTMVEADGPTRAVVRIVDWVGGAGSKPSTGYIGADGALVGTAAAAYDFFGPLSTALTALKSGAETARTGAETARSGAEGAAASISFIYEINSTRYWYGKPVVSASEDPDNKGAWVVTNDGYAYAKWAIRTKTANGLTFSKNEGDGFYELSLGSAEGVIPLGSAGAAIDTSALRYFAGGRVLWGAGVDPDERAPLFVNEHGYTFGKFNFIAGSGVSITFDGASMATTFSVAPVPNPDVLLVGNNGAVIDPTGLRYFAGFRVTWAAGVDANDRAPIFVTEDGTIWGKFKIVGGPGIDVTFDGSTMTTKIASQTGALADNPLDTANYLFATKTVAGKLQIMRWSKLLGAASQATFVGNNLNPRLSYDGSKLLYSSDRDGGRDIYFQALAGGTEYPAMGFRRITPLGDSMTAGGMADLVAAYFGIPLSTPSSGPGGGIGSQKADQIAGRADAIPLTCSVASNTISAGVNVLTAINIMIMSRASDAEGTVRSLKASIGGVTGVLTSTQSATPVAGSIMYDATNHYVYSFTPDGGQALPAAMPAGSALRINLEDRDHDFLMLWVGRNNVGIPGWQAEVKAKIAAILARQQNLVGRFMLIGVTNAVNEPSGSTNYNEIVAFNAELATLYPDRVWDPRPTFNAGTADDTPAPALRADLIHYNGGAGRTAFANGAIAFIQSKGLL